MTNRPAGFSRHNIQGHMVMGDLEAIRALRRLSTITIGHIFLQAREHGNAVVNLDDQHWMLSRNPDHTFTLSKNDPHRYSM